MIDRTPAVRWSDQAACRRTGAIESKNKGGPAEVSLGRAEMSAITYFPAEQYHRQTGLHFCVRDGNRCFPRLVVTDKRVDELSPVDTSRA